MRWFKKLFRVSEKAKTKKINSTERTITDRFTKPQSTFTTRAITPSVVANGYDKPRSSTVTSISSAPATSPIEGTGLNPVHSFCSRSDTTSQEVEQLIKELSCNPDPSERCSAAFKLARLANSRALEPLFNALNEDIIPFRSSYVREAAAQALGELGDKRAVKPLLSVLKKYSDAGRTGRAAATALGRLGDRRAVESLIDVLNDSVLSESAAQALGMLGEPRAVDPLVDLLRGQYNNYPAEDALVQFGPAYAVVPLIRTLDEASADVRVRIARVLGELHDERAVTALADLLRDSEDEVRSAAAKALGIQGNKRAVQPLIDALVKGEISAARSLGELKDVNAVEPLIAKLASCRADRWENNYMREAIAGALAKIGDSRAVEPLIDAFAYAPSDNRKDVMDALVKLLEVTGGGDADLRTIWCERALEVLLVLYDEEGVQLLFDKLGFDRTAITKELLTKCNIDLSIPLINSLGMELLPVPSAKVLFGKYVVTNEEYRKFKPHHNSNVSGYMEEGWVGNPDINGDRHPVVNVCVNDARKFCGWLTVTERRAGRIGLTQRYRLPLDWEWSVAVGLNELKESSVKEKAKDYVPVFPWGTEWPPPKDAGHLEGEKTVPVGSYRVGAYGLYDMCGNVLQFCDDCFPSSNEVLRGSSYRSINDKLWLASQKRGYLETRHAYYPWLGFRIVLVEQ
jgi:HEAT repeat protein